MFGTIYRISGIILLCIFIYITFFTSFGAVNAWKISYKKAVGKVCKDSWCTHIATKRILYEGGITHNYCKEHYRNAPKLVGGIHNTLGSIFFKLLAFLGVSFILFFNIFYVISLIHKGPNSVFSNKLINLFIFNSFENETPNFSGAKTDNIFESIDLNKKDSMFSDITFKIIIGITLTVLVQVISWVLMFLWGY
jgi:hypothetical protein